MAQLTKRNIVIQSIKDAQTRILKRQNLYREMLKQPPRDKETAYKELKALGPLGLLDSLKDLSYPISSRFKHEHLIDPREFKTEAEAKIELVEDDEIRSLLYFSNGYEEYGRCIHFAATLYNQYGSILLFNTLFDACVNYRQSTWLENAVQDQSLLRQADSGSTCLHSSMEVAKAVASMVIMLGNINISPSARQEVCDLALMLKEN